MGLLSALRKQENEEGESNWFFECRNCGKTVESKATVCPACGAAEIACYQL